VHGIFAWEELDNGRSKEISVYFWQYLDEKRQKPITLFFFKKFPCAKKHTF
jgi:hypothetical protein